ncbi:MAG: dihydropteroate synthase [Flavobacteriales bacterium]
MGILNVTPDSFYDGGNYQYENEILARATEIIDQGATLIDIGGYSSRPGAEEVTLDEELKRVIPAIKLIIEKYPEALISVDTFRSEVARKSIEAGACMINDISAGEMDSKMFSTIRELQVPYCMMHMQETPQNMQQNPTYKNVTEEVFYYLGEKISELQKLGVNDIIVDPGFGFGKTIEHNYELLRNLSFFTNLNQPILVGVSRKSMIYKTLGITAQDSLNGTTALHGFALQQGGNILRVHDVKEAMEVIALSKILTFEKKLSN